MEEGRSVFKILTDKLIVKRSWRRWEDDIKMEIKEIGVNTRNWVGSTQDRDN